VAFSRQQVLHKAVVNLKKLVHDDLGLFQRLVGPGITIDLNLDPNLWHTKADRLQMEQVLMNLANNARDAMPGGGTLTVTTKNVVVEAESNGQMHPPGQYVQLEVRDTGTGIPRDIRARIFDPFFTTKDLGQGIGLGLSTVYGIVRQSDGTIDVESEMGRGTALTIHLPRTTEQPKDDAGRASRRA
jgi:two-component system cell cycle sensor histidine kinase/response regulator CckA